MTTMNLLNLLPQELLVGINEYAQDKELKKKMLDQLKLDAFDHQHIWDWARCRFESDTHKECWEVCHRNKYAIIYRNNR